MKDSTEIYSTDLNRLLAIKELTPEYANDLVSAGFPFDFRELYPSLSQKLLHATGLIPRVNRLVAYHIEEKHAIGFLCLIEDSNYHALRKASLKNVFPPGPCHNCEFWKINFEPKEEQILDGKATMNYGYIYKTIKKNN